MNPNANVNRNPTVPTPTPITNNFRSPPSPARTNGDAIRDLAGAVSIAPNGGPIPAHSPHGTSPTGRK